MANFTKISQTLKRCGNLTGFKMAAVHHLEFMTHSFLMTGEAKRPFCTSIPNFVKIGQTVAEISRFFVIFHPATAAILDCQKFKILLVFCCKWTVCVNLPNFIDMKTFAVIWPFNGFLPRDAMHPRY